MERKEGDGRMMKTLKNPVFWIGADIVLIMWVFTDFLEGRKSIKETIITGVILILLVGLNRMDIEKQKGDGINEQE
jgi:tellurite resistance protein TehA-like permease